MRRLAPWRSWGRRARRGGRSCGRCWPRSGRAASWLSSGWRTPLSRRRGRATRSAPPLLLLHFLLRIDAGLCNAAQPLFAATRRLHRCVCKPDCSTSHFCALLIASGTLSRTNHGICVAGRVSGSGIQGGRRPHRQTWDVGGSPRAEAGARQRTTSDLPAAGVFQLAELPKPYHSETVCRMPSIAVP